MGNLTCPNFFKKKKENGLKVTRLQNLPSFKSYWAGKNGKK